MADQVIRAAVGRLVGGEQACRFPSTRRCAEIGKPGVGTGNEQRLLSRLLPLFAGG